MHSALLFSKTLSWFNKAPICSLSLFLSPNQVLDFLLRALKLPDSLGMFPFLPVLLNSPYQQSKQLRPTLQHLIPHLAPILISDLASRQKLDCKERARNPEPNRSKLPGCWTGSDQEEDEVTLLYIHPHNMIREPPKAAPGEESKGALKEIQNAENIKKEHVSPSERTSFFSPTLQWPEFSDLLDDWPVMAAGGIKTKLKKGDEDKICSTDFMNTVDHVLSTTRDAYAM